jgi:hypothetical protein
VSVASDISAAIATAVTGIVPGAPIKSRKVPTLAEDENPPLVIVSVAEEGDLIPMTASKDFVRRPASVTVIKGGGTKQANEETTRTERAAIIAAVNKPSAFAGVAEFNEVNATGRAPFNPAALAKDFNYSTLVFTVETIEARAR